MTKVYLSLGSNMGNRQDYLKKAVESLDRLLETEVKAVSSYYENLVEPQTGQAYKKYLSQIDTSDVRKLEQVD